MNTYTFHIDPYDLAFLGVIFTGLNFALLMAFTKRTSRLANVFLAMALVVMILWIIRISAIDTKLPLQFSLALGPLIYFYVRKLTRPEYKFCPKDLLHFVPALPEQFILPSPVLPYLAFISVITYLYCSHRLIKCFYRRLKFNGGDRYRYELRWLHKLLKGFGFLWLLWIPFTAVDYFYYHNQLGTQAYYPFYLCIAIMLIWIAAAAYLRPEVSVPVHTPAFFKPSPPAELKQKGAWLKNVVKANRYYEDPELSLGSLAAKLELTTHELSRIINQGLKKSFNDFINEYRVAEVKRKMQDPAYNHMNLIGVAYESGFNSKTTFNRAFKQLTGKNPVDYKNVLKKEAPSYNSGLPARFAILISNHETTLKWSDEKSNRSFMLKNYLKIAVRQLLKQKIYGAIKIGGFALSIAACILITLYIRNEASYDRSYPHANRIYRLISTTDVGSGTNVNNYMPAPVAKTYSDNFPEIEKAGRIMSDPEFSGAGSNEIRIADQVQNTHEEGFAYADQAILDILQVPMVYGERANALTAPHTMVISKRKADKYFPGQNPVGKVLYLNNDLSKPYKINGVMQDLPTTSHLQYDFILSLKGVEMFPGEQNNWAANNYDVYVLLRPGTDLAAFEKKSSGVMFEKYIIPGMISAGIAGARAMAQNATIRLQPITAIHLRSADIHDNYTHGDIRFIWLFAAIAGFILIIACVNFVNLSTAKSANRAKEVGLRKVVGSTRFGLIGQFLTESLFYSLLSFIIGALLAWALLPYFNSLADKSLTMPWLNWWFIPTLLLAAAFTGLLAGLYPAFYLSGFNPAKVLKGTLSAGSKSSVLRNGLVIFQFTTSIILIISTLVIYNQMQFILNKKLGFEKDQVVLLEGANTLGKQVVSLKDELKKLSEVKSVSVSDYLPVAGTKRSSTLFYSEGREKVENAISGQIWQVDPDYLKTMGIKLVQGRNFSAAFAADSQAVVINHALADELNLKDPVGKRILVGGRLSTVIGEAFDFNFESLRDRVDGLAMQLGNSPSIIAVKVNPGNMKNAINAISSVWKQFAPTQPIRYSFLDARFAAMYADVQRMGSIFTSFAILAIIISCLGLFALAAFMAEQRSKEIGIRKVLGATVTGITSLLSVEFLKLVLISILIASPIAWYAMHKWLEDFTYRADISWWIFAMAGSVAAMVAVFTVGFQCIKAAMANPVNSLKGG